MGRARRRKRLGRSIVVCWNDGGIFAFGLLREDELIEDLRKMDLWRETLGVEDDRRMYYT